MARRFQPIGYDVMIRQLRALPESYARNIGPAIRDGASELAAAVQSAAPEYLQSGVGSAAGVGKPSTEAGEQYRGEQASKGLAARVFAGKSGKKGHVHNPIWDEYGIEPHSVAPGAHRKSGALQDVGPHNPGRSMRPFFWPTIRSHEKLIQARILAAGRKALSEAAGK